DDINLAVVIVPGGTYVSDIGGEQTDSAYVVGVDASVNMYVAGETFSSDLPVKAPLQDVNRGNRDAFVSKFDAKGALVYTTYIGGSGSELVDSLAVDAAGNAYVAGYTDSSNFPTSDNATQTANRGGSFLGTDAYFFKLDPA